PTAEHGDAVRLLTAHAAKGLEWDLVVVAGVQEGVWPDLRLRGSVLGSEQLVDILAERALPEGRASAAAQVAEVLQEERRLFYVAVTRARRHLRGTAVDPSGTGSGGDEQPSRFLAELVNEIAVRSETEEAEESVVPKGLLRRPITLPALVAELR